MRRGRMVKQLESTATHMSWLAGDTASRTALVNGAGSWVVQSVALVDTDNAMTVEPVVLDSTRVSVQGVGMGVGVEEGG